MSVQSAPRLFDAIHIRLVSDGDVRMPAFGRPQCPAWRHRNATSIRVPPFVDPGHRESHPVPCLVETERSDRAWNVGVQPIVDEVRGIRLGHVTPCSTIGAMPLAVAVTTPSCRLADVSKERAVDRIVHVELCVHDALLTWWTVVVSACLCRHVVGGGNGRAYIRRRRAVSNEPMLQNRRCSGPPKGSARPLRRLRSLQWRGTSERRRLQGEAGRGVISGRSDQWDIEVLGCCLKPSGVVQCCHDLFSIELIIEHPDIRLNKRNNARS
jgi:hypothetical protein